MKSKHKIRVIGKCFLLVFAILAVVLTVGGKEGKPVEEEAPERESANIPLIADFFPVENYSYERSEPVDHVVLHFTSAIMVSFEDPYDYQTNRQIFLDGEVSTHYLIDREGTVYQWIPENRAAWHVGSGEWREEKYTNALNYYSIGIELMAIGSEEEMGIYMSEATYGEIEEERIGYTQAQYASLNLLLDDIVACYPAIERNREHILGHDQYSATKVDPGSLFNWRKIGIE